VWRTSAASVQALRVAFEAAVGSSTRPRALVHAVLEVLLNELVRSWVTAHQRLRYLCREGSASPACIAIARTVMQKLLRTRRSTAVQVCVLLWGDGPCAGVRTTV
jgi:hypothetical protein